MPVKLDFIEDERKTRRKDAKFTDFDEEIKSLKKTILKNTKSEEMDSIYNKLEQLL
jgi:hypothetical protein